jgi:hypothetical protein
MKELRKGKKGKREKGTEDGNVTLPELLEVQRTRVICGPELNYHVRLYISSVIYTSFVCFAFTAVTGMSGRWARVLHSRQCD